MSSLVVVQIGSTAGGGGTHGIMVVLAHKDNGELPQHSHVVRLEKLALIGSTITIEGESDGASIEVLLGKGEASTQRSLRPNDAVSTPELARDIEHVHGSTLAL